MGELKPGSDPHIRATVCKSEEKHLRLRVKQLISGSLNGMRITVLAAAVHTLDRDTGPLEGTAAGSWSLGSVEQSQGEGCC